MKKILAMLVALTMLVGGLGISAIAEEETANDYKIGILAPAVTMAGSLRSLTMRSSAARSWASTTRSRPATTPRK